MPALIECLSDDAVEVRVTAASELGHLGAVAKTALPALERVEKGDRRAAVREAASEAIMKIR